MCLKLVVWALTWDEVIARGKRALDDMRLHGIKTTAQYYQQILEHPDFRAGIFKPPTTASTFSGCSTR